MNSSSTWTPEMAGTTFAPTSIGVYGAIRIDGFSEQKMSFDLRTNQAGAAVPVPVARATRVHEGSTLTKAALDHLTGADRCGAAVARRVLSKFAAAADAFDVANAPDLHLVEEDDGAILIEWAFADRRLGFSLEQQPEDSGWYFVLSSASSERYEAGTLDQLEMGRLVGMMLSK